MDHDEAVAEGHEPHEKAVQLDVDLDNNARGQMSDEDIDAAWETACTVDEAKNFLDALAEEG